MISEKVRFGDHHVVSKASEVSGIFQFFSENITGIDDTRNVEDLGGTFCAHFPNFVFTETHVLSVFVS